MNTGHGKGKSKTALGMVVRGMARDWKVGVVQFLKSGKWQVGEEKVCRARLGVDWLTIGEGVTWNAADTDGQRIGGRAGHAQRRRRPSPTPAASPR